MVEINEENAAEKAAEVRARRHIPAKSVSEAFGRVFAEITGYVQKTGQMQGAARYSYAREGDFIASVRPAMARHGLALIPREMEILVSEVVQTATGKPMNRIVLGVRYDWQHAASGESFPAYAVGEGMDSGDKAANKAMTAAYKYALRESLCVETGDDPDDTASEQQQRVVSAGPNADQIIRDYETLNGNGNDQNRWKKISDHVASRNDFTPDQLARIRNAAKHSRGRPQPQPAGAP